MDYAFKVLLLGDGGVGKTTLIKRYVTGSFDPKTKMSVGVEFHSKFLTVEGREVQLVVWDFGGEERFRFIIPGHSRGARGGIFVYDVTNLQSLLHAREWLNLVRAHAGDIPIVMVGTKIDLVDRRVVPSCEASEKAAELGITHVLEASAKTGETIEEIFETITRLIFDNLPT